MAKPRIRVQATSRSVAELTVVPFRQPEADEEIVRVVAQFEHLAKSGGLVSIAVVGINRAGDLCSAYVSGPSLFALMGGAHQLLRRVSSGVAVT